MQQFVVKIKVAPGHYFYVKSVDASTRQISIEPKIDDATRFDSKDNAKLYMKGIKDCEIIPVDEN